MPKHKIYFNWEIPTGVVNIVKAVCADYERRERMIKYSSIAGKVLEQYVHLNRIVDDSLQDVEVALRKVMLQDISQKVGYSHSQAQMVISKNAYYRRRRKVIYNIAISLNLI